MSRLFPHLHRRLEDNRLLASLPAETRAKLQPHLTRVALRQGDVLHAAGGPIQYAYFPTSSLVCLQYPTRGGPSVEIAVVGSDGVVSIAPLLGAPSPNHHAIAHITGDALRIDAKALTTLFASSEPLRRALLLYTHVLMTQIGQVALCNSVHSLPQRLCRWLLVCRDRLGTMEFPATQEDLARLLGVRRESICHAATTLQNEGLLRYVRGHVHIVDSPRLEAAACECHGVIQTQYARLLNQPV